MLKIKRSRKTRSKNAFDACKEFGVESDNCYNYLRFLPKRTKKRIISMLEEIQDEIRDEIRDKAPILEVLTLTPTQEDKCQTVVKTWLQTFVNEQPTLEEYEKFVRKETFKNSLSIDQIDHCLTLLQAQFAMPVTNETIILPNKAENITVIDSGKKRKTKSKSKKRKTKSKKRKTKSKSKSRRRM